MSRTEIQELQARIEASEAARKKEADERKAERAKADRQALVEHLRKGGVAEAQAPALAAHISDRLGRDRAGAITFRDQYGCSLSLEQGVSEFLGGEGASWKATDAERGGDTKPTAAERRGDFSDEELAGAFVESVLGNKAGRDDTLFQFMGQDPKRKRWG